MGEDSRIAVVTGGSRGIGLATATRLLQQGYRVALIGLRPALPAEVANSLTGDWRYISADVSLRSSMEAAADEVLATWSRVDALVSNAGIYPRQDALTMSTDEWNRVIQVNLGGTFHSCQAFGGPMLAAGKGVIVTMSSGIGVRGAVRSSAYAASKAGIIALTRSLAAEWAPTVRVNCVVPGIIDTDMPRIGRTEDEMVTAGQRNPLGRVGQAADVAGAVSFLLGDDAAYITGQCLGVNGGGLMM